VLGSENLEASRNVMYVFLLNFLYLMEAIQYSLIPCITLHNILSVVT
jgi:hypothetical protein